MLQKFCTRKFIAVIAICSIAVAFLAVVSAIVYRLFRGDSPNELWMIGAALLAPLVKPIDLYFHERTGRDTNTGELINTQVSI